MYILKFDGWEIDHYRISKSVKTLKTHCKKIFKEMGEEVEFTPYADIIYVDSKNSIEGGIISKIKEI